MSDSTGVPRTPLSELAEAVRLSSTAQVVIEMVDALPEETLRDLKTLLVGRLTEPTPAELRERQVGLLYELIDARDGDWPGAPDYEQERQRREEAGESGWPSPEALAVAYGDWTRACYAAWRLWEAGTQARVPAGYEPASEFIGQRRDIIGGLQEFRKVFGHWPTQWEYDTWAKVKRRTHKRRGQAPPRLPTLQRITELLTSWDRALALAVKGW